MKKSSIISFSIVAIVLIASIVVLAFIAQKKTWIKSSSSIPRAERVGYVAQERKLLQWDEPSGPHVRSKRSVRKQNPFHTPDLQSEYLKKQKIETGREALRAKIAELQRKKWTPEEKEAMQNEGTWEEIAEQRMAELHSAEQELSDEVEALKEQEAELEDFRKKLEYLIHDLQYVEESEQSANQAVEEALRNGASEEEIREAEEAAIELEDLDSTIIEQDIDSLTEDEEELAKELDLPLIAGDDEEDEEEAEELSEIELEEAKDRAERRKQNLLAEERRVKDALLEQEEILESEIEEAEEEAEQQEYDEEVELEEFGNDSPDTRLEHEETQARLVDLKSQLDDIRDKLYRLDDNDN